MKKTRVPEKLKKLIREAAQDYRTKLHADAYDLKVEYMEDDLPPTDSGGDVAMDIRINRRYLMATVHVYPWYISKWEKKHYSDNEIKEAVAHEIAHLATQHFFDVAVATYRDEGEMKDAWETCTTVIGRLLHRLP